MLMLTVAQPETYTLDIVVKDPRAVSSTYIALYLPKSLLCYQRGKKSNNLEDTGRKGKSLLTGYISSFFGVGVYRWREI